MLFMCDCLFLYITNLICSSFSVLKQRNSGKRNYVLVCLQTVQAWIYVKCCCRTVVNKINFIYSISISLTNVGFISNYPNNLGYNIKYFPRRPCRLLSLSTKKWRQCQIQLNSSVEKWQKLWLRTKSMIISIIDDKAYTYNIRAN